MSSSKQDKIIYGQHEIQFTLEFVEKKRLSITVEPDMTVVVRAPRSQGIEAVRVRVKKRAPWLLKQLRFFEQYQPPVPSRRYVAGETHTYLGRSYRLKLVSDQKPTVKLKGRYFIACVPVNSDSETIRKLMENWYREHARKIFQNRLELCLETAQRFGIPSPGIQIRKMKTRWGSYTQSENVLLNLDLIKAPLFCIDYVIMHELCHLKEPYHNTRFFRLLAKCQPDWEMRKERLAKVIV